MTARIRAHLAVAYGLAALCLVLALTGSAYAVGAAAGAAAATRAQLCTVTDKPNGGQVLDCDPYAAASPSSSPTSSPSATPSPTVTASPTPTPSPSTTTTPPAGGFPTATSVGVPAGWQPTVTYTPGPSGYTIDQPGTYSDFRVHGTLNIRAAGVTLRRVEVVGGVIDNENAGRCYGGLTVLDSTVRNSTASNGAIQPGGYTARRVALVDVGEGFRIGGRSDAGCGAVLVEDSYVRLMKPASVSCSDWHGDAVQGFDAPLATLVNVTLDARHRSDCSAAGVFYGDAEDNGNQPLTVRKLLVLTAPGGTAYRPDTPHDTEGLRIFRDGGGSLLGGSFTCARATRWVDNATSNATGTTVVAPIAC